jgi:hypothetical protein
MQQRATPLPWSGHWMTRKPLNASVTKFIGCPCVRNWKNCATPNKNHRTKYAAEQGIAEEEALKKGMEEKSRQFVEKGAELYAKA